MGDVSTLTTIGVSPTMPLHHLGLQATVGGIPFKAAVSPTRVPLPEGGFPPRGPDVGPTAGVPTRHAHSGLSWAVEVRAERLAPPTNPELNIVHHTTGTFIDGSGTEPSAVKTTTEEAHAPQISGLSHMFLVVCTAPVCQQISFS